MEHIYSNIQGWFDGEKTYNFIIDKLPNNFKFVEVGVWKGRSLSYFVVESINKNKIGNIYAVDTWEGSLEHKKDHNNLFNDELLYKEFLSNINPIKENIIIIKKTSIEASQDFENESLDSVFIDASHEYNDIKQDLISWYPKIKTGGILSGHDYEIGWPGVLRAVNEFALHNNYKIENNGSYWWLLK
jgi:hypothetical protein